MDVILPCGNCESQTDCSLMVQEETATIEGKPVTFTATFYQCNICGEEFELPGQLDANLNAAREAWKQKYGLA